MKNDLLKSLGWRYATKKFDIDKSVSKDTIDRIIEAFNLTATSFGLQPVKLVVVKDKTIQNKLTEASWGQNQVRTASHILVFCIHKKITPEYIHAYYDMEIDIRQTESHILAPYRERTIQMFSELDKNKVRSWATNQAYLTIGNMLTFCAHEGVDTCPMEGFDKAIVNEVLDLEEHNLESVLLLPIGYRAADDFFSSLEKVRKPIEDSVIFY